MKLRRLPSNVIRWGWNKVLDRLFGPPEDFVYESRTHPMQLTNDDIDAQIKERSD